MTLPFELITPGRKITGYSAVLLPLCENGAVDWDGFSQTFTRTRQAGLMPAVNMDTGYANLIDEATRLEVLRKSQQLSDDGLDLPHRFVAGAFVGDQPGDPFQLSAYQKGIEEIQEHAGIPVLFQSYGLTQQENAAIVDGYQQIAAVAPEFIGFELGTMFAPFGKIYDLEVYEQLMAIPQCIGAKHSSLSRELEWDRLRLRNAKRPDFKVFTGNDLAIDMVMYGSDYLLGLSTFAPEEFALRDRYWETQDNRFFELNDLLQYLGMLAFRNPVPAYKHNAAQFQHLRGWIATNKTYPGSPERPAADEEILKDLLSRLISNTKN